jgi:DNA-directed RNA polymerase II subunit RPB1
METINDTISKSDSADLLECITTVPNTNNLYTRIHINKENDSEISGIQDQSDIIASFKNIETMLLNDIVIKGIPNITNIVASNMNSDYIYKEGKEGKEGDYICKNSGEVKCNKEGSEGSEGEQEGAVVDNWVLETDGVNLSNIMTHSKVDYTKCFSNDILEMQLYLGIEAAREMLLKEMYAVVDDAGEYVNLRHLQLLVDLMTSRGVIMPTNRQGINRGDNGTLAKMSFEDTTEQIMKAGLFGDCDNLKGVSANIMMGQVVPCGTGNFDILLDEEIIKKNVQEKTEEIDDKEINVEEMLDGSDEEDAYCNDEHLDFSFNVE